MAAKWISDLKTSTPLAAAARRVLTVRLEAVRDAIPPALHAAEEDPEHVHQLRVSTRRARAAVDIFAPCLSPRAYRQARKRLRRIRRAAGEARDWDVFLADLLTWGRGRSARDRPGLLFLMGYGSAQRLAAQDHLDELDDGYPFSFDRFLGETLVAVRAPDQPGPRTLGDLARPVLRDLLRELGDAAAGDLDDEAHLHAVRILGKRLRYAMEVFADCFASPFRDALYPAVEEMQEILGNANDSSVARARLEALLTKLPSLVTREAKRMRPGIENLLQRHAERLGAERKRFRAWWDHWRHAGLEAAFLALLGPADAGLSIVRPPSPGESA